MAEVFTGLIPDSDEVRADFESRALPMSWNYREYFNQLDVLIDETHDVTQWLRIENQGGVGSCQGAALTTGAETVHYYESGCEDVVQLSKLFAYIGSQEAGGGANGDTGSSMISGIRLLQGTGIPLESTVPYTDRYNTMRARYQDAKRNAAVLEEARKYIVPDHLVCESFEQAMAWVACRCGSVHIGMRWPIPIDSRGVGQNYRRAGNGGHAVEGVTAQKIDGTWYLKVANSHSTRYGDAGYFYLGKQDFEDIRRENRFGVYLIGAPGTWEEPRYTGQFPLMG